MAYSVRAGALRPPGRLTLSGSTTTKPRIRFGNYGHENEAGSFKYLMEFVCQYHPPQGARRELSTWGGRPGKLIKVQDAKCFAITVQPL